MKKDIHPKYYPDAKIICACGTVIETGSTVPEISVELCSACHPFYTGKQKLVDSAKRVDKYYKKLEKQEEVSKTRKGKKVKKENLKAKAAAEKKENEK